MEAKAERERQLKKLKE